MEQDAPGERTALTTGEEVAPPPQRAWRRPFAVVIVGVWLALVVALERESRELSTEAVATGDKPNVFLITIDDAGWNDFPSALVTPNLARYASEGVRLSQYYGQPSCSPSRATLLTGVWVHRLGFQDSEVSVYSNFSTPLRYETIAARLKRLGYDTVGWGKWNIGHCADAFLPWNRGFDYFCGYFTAAIDYRTRSTGRNYSHGGRPRELYDQLEGWANGTWRKPSNFYDSDTYDTLLYARAAAAELARHQRPLFAWLAFHGVHADTDDNTTVTDAEIGVSGLAELRATLNGTNGRTQFAEAMYVVDVGVGHLVETARDLNKLGVVIVHSDNGAMPCTYGGADIAGSNYPLRSGKFQYFEGGVRLPAFVYAPSLLIANPGATYQGLMHHVDWLPTIVVGLARGTISDDEDVAIDGVDHWDYIRRAASTHELPPPTSLQGPRREIVFDISTANMNLSDGSDSAPVDLRLAYADAVVAYRYDNYKLLKRHTDDPNYYSPHATYLANCTAQFCMMNRELYTTEASHCGFTDFLFNLTDDPLEQTNLADDPDFRELRQDLERRAQLHFAKAFYQPLNHVSRSSVVANHAFFQAGDVVVPWGDEADCNIVS